MPVSVKHYQLIFNPDFYNQHYIELTNITDPIIGQFEDIGLHGPHTKNVWKLSGNPNQENLQKLIASHTLTSHHTYHIQLVKFNPHYDYTLLEKAQLDNWSANYYDKKDLQTINALIPLYNIIYQQKNFTSTHHHSYLYKLVDDRNHILLQVIWPKDITKQSAKNLKLELQKAIIQNDQQINTTVKNLTNMGKAMSDAMSNLNTSLQNLANLLFKPVKSTVNNTMAQQNQANIKAAQDLAFQNNLIRIDNELDLIFPFKFDSPIKMSKRYFIPFKKYRKNLFDKQLDEILQTLDPVKELYRQTGIKVGLITNKKTSLLLANIIHDGQTPDDDHLQQRFLKTFIKAKAYQKFLNNYRVQNNIQKINTCESTSDPDGTKTLDKVVKDIDKMAQTDQVDIHDRSRIIHITENYWVLLDPKQQFCQTIESRKLRHKVKSFF